MLKSNTNKFMEKVLAHVVDCVSAEDCATVEEALQVTLENLETGRNGNWGYLPKWQRPAVVSPANVQYFIQGLGGHFEYREYAQIEILASFYCENEQEKAQYIARWEKVLDRKGYEPIVEHYAYIVYKGIVKALKAYKVKEA